MLSLAIDGSIACSVQFCHRLCFQYLRALLSFPSGYVFFRFVLDEAFPEWSPVTSDKIILLIVLILDKNLSLEVIPLWPWFVCPWTPHSLQGSVPAASAYRSGPWDSRDWTPWASPGGISSGDGWTWKKRKIILDN